MVKPTRNGATLYRLGVFLSQLAKHITFLGALCFKVVLVRPEAGLLDGVSSIWPIFVGN